MKTAENTGKLLHSFKSWFKTWFK